MEHNLFLDMEAGPYTIFVCRGLGVSISKALQLQGVEREGSEGFLLALLFKFLLKGKGEQAGICYWMWIMD